MDINFAEEKYKELKLNLDKNIQNIKTEEDTKVQAITRMLTEVLGWEHSDIKCEAQNENGFSDYEVTDKGSPALIVEAKKIGAFEVKTAEINRVKYLKLSGSSLSNALPGTRQAAGYAATKGFALAVLTDGIAWIVFKPYVPGYSYLEKQAIVFPSLDAIENSFSVFFELLSKCKVGNHLYNLIFDKLHNKSILMDQKLIAAIPTNEIKLLGKHGISFDLDKVFNRFFSRLTGDSNKQLLYECFVETRESRIADFSLEKMTTSVLGNIVTSDQDMDTELERLISDNISLEDVTEEAGQTVFIVGPTGAGKTTFVERFFNWTLAPTVRKHCVVMNVNCLDDTGNEAAILDWIREQLIESLHSNLYQDGRPSWDELRALYHGEYLSRALGVDAILYNRDKMEFKEKFSSFLEEKIYEDRDGYVKRILADVVKNRKMLPILIVDNIDEFSIDYKQKIFQYIQALRRHANHCIVLFPITDKSAWSFSKTDIYGIYSSKSFFLPTPSPREVFRKRIDFLKDRISEELDGRKDRKGYFLSKGIRLSIDDLNGFAKVIEKIFVEDDFTAKTIGELSNYNIRRTLALSQRVITSPLIRIEDLIKTFLSGEISGIDYPRFIDALLKGDYEAFKDGGDNEIYPIFNVDDEIAQSPLLALRILSLLNAIKKDEKDISSKHMDVKAITSYFDVMAFSEVSVEGALRSLFLAGLIEPFDVSSKYLGGGQRFAISYKGSAHLRLATRDGVYFYQMALTTPIKDEECALRIRRKYNSNSNFYEKIQIVKKLFLNYLIDEDKCFLSLELPKDARYENQNNLIFTLHKFAHSSTDSQDFISDMFGDRYRVGVIESDLAGTLEQFDIDKNYGFVKCQEIEESIHIHGDRLKEGGIKNLKVGDTIYFDLAREEKGFYVAKINKVERELKSIKIIDCKLSRYFKERGFGFVKDLNSDLSAYFHVSILLPDDRELLEEGIQLKVEVGPDIRGKGFNVREFIAIGS